MRLLGRAGQKIPNDEHIHEVTVVHSLEFIGPLDYALSKLQYLPVNTLQISQAFRHKIPPKEHDADRTLWRSNVPLLGYIPYEPGGCSSTSYLHSLKLVDLLPVAH